MIWPRVNKETPCPVCEKTDWCQIGDKSVKCMRIQSDKPSGDGGWYHYRFTGEIRPMRVPTAPAPTKIGINFEAMLIAWRQETSPVAFAAHCRRLDVSPESMEQLCACWSRHYAAWAFPMRDGAGRICGIRLRSEDGRKWAVPGSSQGMFYSMSLPEKLSLLLIAEGPTSTAAAMDMGFFAAGRPNCNGSPEQIRVLMNRLKVSTALIVADTDNKQRPDGTWWNPGAEGANRLGEKLNKRHIVWSCPSTEIKDLRDYKKAGGSMQLLMDEIKNRLWG